MNQEDQVSNAFVKSVDGRIRGVLSTPGLAVAMLVVCCITVEMGILAATQQYEAATAPPGTTILFGMSSAGMVVFLAELLKLPVAWVSGVVIGRNRIIFNVVTAGLCLLTAITIKDLTTREWNLALEPARALHRKSDEKFAEIASLEKKKADLAQDTNNANAYWREQIEQTNAQLDSLQKRKALEQAAHTERLRALIVQADPGSEERIRSLEQIRDKEIAAIDNDIADLQRQLEVERSAARTSSDSDATAFEKIVLRVQEERKAVEARNLRAEQAAAANYESDVRRYNTETVAYESARKEYEAARSEIIKKRDQRLKDLEGQDKAFFDITAKKAEVTKEVAKEIARLEADFKARPAPVAPVRAPAIVESLPPIPTKESAAKMASDSPRMVEIRKSITALQQNRTKALAESAGKITAIVDRVAVNAATETAASAEQRKLLEDNFNKLVRGFDAQIAALMERRTKEEGERSSVARSPVEIQRESDTITAKLPELRTEAEALKSQAEQAAIDTNPVRTASGVIRWLMPNSTPQEQEAAAFGTFPPLIGLLVASLPALLLELGVHSLKPHDRKSRRGMLKSLMAPRRHRKALEIHWARAEQDRLRRKEQEDRVALDRATLEERALRQRVEIDQKAADEVARRVVVFEQERTTLMESVNKVTQEHVELSAKYVTAMKEVNARADDIARLMKHIHYLDARTTPPSSPSR